MNKHEKKSNNKDISLIKKNSSKFINNEGNFFDERARHINKFILILIININPHQGTINYNILNPWFLLNILIINVYYTKTMIIFKNMFWMIMLKQKIKNKTNKRIK